MTTGQIYPRKSSKVKPKSLSKKCKKKSEHVQRLSVVWNLLKGMIFICCLTIFFYQSTSFLQVYWKYPTISRVEFTYPAEYTLPAVTMCSGNTLKRSKFCAEYPKLCKIPENITEFCELYPPVCRKNASNPVILSAILSTNETLRKETYHAFYEVYRKGNRSNEYFEEWTWSVTTDSSMEPVFVQEPKFSMCYTENLHLSSSKEPRKMYNPDAREDFRRISSYKLNIESSEEVDYTDESTAYISIHSPYDPINPIRERKRMQLGNKYSIFYRMEEKRLLKHPYETNCTDYIELWSKRSHRGPRSQRMCQELCFHDLLQKKKKIPYSFRMLEYPVELCEDYENCPVSSEEAEHLLHCKNDCKESCRSLKYVITRFETEEIKLKKKTRDSESQRDIIEVEIFLGDLQVIEEQHVPTYDTGYLVSYIGGLMGFYLGVSIWDFAAIAETLFRRFLQWMQQIKLYFKRLFQH